MLVSLIVLVVLRMFSILWLVQGLIEMATAFSTVYLTPSDGPYIFLKYLTSIVTLAIAVGSWVVAPLLTRKVVGKQDTTLAISGLTREDLYCFAFIFLGLYFALSSLGSLLNWIHFVFLWKTVPVALGADRPEPNYYSLSQALITFIAGLLCLFKGRRWSAKLIRAGK